jgi:hypothetical protein
LHPLHVVLHDHTTWIVWSHPSQNVLYSLCPPPLITNSPCSWYSCSSSFLLYLCNMLCCFFCFLACFCDVSKGSLGHFKNDSN